MINHHNGIMLTTLKFNLIFKFGEKYHTDMLVLFSYLRITISRFSECWIQYH